MKVKTIDIIKEKGIDAEWYCSEPSEPALSNVRFKDILPELTSGGPRSRNIADKILYKHQLEVIKLLRNGYNVILISGTGSGKTEAWVTYAIKNNVRTLAIYPTLALSSDQLSRIKDYYESVGLGEAVMTVDSSVCARLGKGATKNKILNSLIVITNPAFLMQDIKRLASNLSKSVLASFLHDVELIVIDELDFYGSHGSSLLMAIIEIISKHISRVKPQVAVLTATLGNPEDLSRYLSGVTGRRTEIVRGRPWRLRNCTYIILGKNLELIRKRALESIKGTPIYFKYKDILENIELFRRNAHVVIEELRKLGFKLPRPYFDISELLTEYVRDDIVTLVFTPSIRSADRLASRVRARLNTNLRDRVAVHHHLIPKKRRADIERAASQHPPPITLIITVRTLLQGIDLPKIGRIVHYGLPEEVREYIQREGRKGRRRELVETETIVVPIRRWDREVLTKGRDGIKYFESLPLERVYVLSNNKYATLFKSLFKIMSQVNLSDHERKLVKDLGLVNNINGKLCLNDKGVKVWRYLNFYEFGPPYGIRRTLVSVDGREIRELEDASRRDLVEKYQAGAVDYSEDSFIIDAGVEGIKEVKVSSVLTHKPLVPKWLAQAISRYESIKIKWGEKPDLLLDLSLGKIMPEVRVTTMLPFKGFGLMTEQPVGVSWIVESRSKYKVVRAGDSLLQLYDKSVVDIDSPTSGLYNDYTYGFIKLIDPDSSYELVKVAAATLRLLLRLHPNYLISTRELRIDAYRPCMGVVAVAVWEPEASGVLERLDWGEVINNVRAFKEPPLWIQFLDMIDHEARDEVLKNKLTWSDVRELALNLAMQLGDLHVVRIMDYEAVIPKHSRNLKLLSVEAIHLDKGTFILGKYDGEEFKVEIIKEKGIPLRVKDWLVKQMELALDNDLRILTSVTKFEDYAFSRSALVLLKELKSRGLIINPLQALKRELKTKMLSINSLTKELRVKDILSFIRSEEAVSKPDRVKDIIKSLLKINVNAYLIYRYITSEFRN